MRKHVSTCFTALLIVIAALLFIAMQGSAQTVQSAPDFKNPTQRRTLYLETVPSLLPSSPTNVWTSDIWLEEITLTNTSGSTVTVTIQDKQGTPVSIVSTTISAGQNMVIEYQARYCPGGITWSASAANAVAGYMRGKR